MSSVTREVHLLVFEAGFGVSGAWGSELLFSTSTKLESHVSKSSFLLHLPTVSAYSLKHAVLITRDLES